MKKKYTFRGRWLALLRASFIWLYTFRGGRVAGWLEELILRLAKAQFGFSLGLAWQQQSMNGKIA